MDKESRSRFDEVYSEIEKCYKSKAKGCMYTAISKLSPDNYQEICDYFKISDNWTIHEDLQFFKNYYFDKDDNQWSNIMDTSNTSNTSNTSLLTSLLEKIGDSFNDFLKNTPEPWLKLYFILFISIIVVGSYVFVKSVIVKKTKKELDSPQKPSPPPLQDSILCLVVPSHQLSALNTGDFIPSSRVKELISSASYFLCDGLDQDQTVNLNLSPDSSINYSSDEDAYIQLIIPGGENIIGKTTKFELRKNLPDGDAKIVTIGRLLKKYGLEKFICA
ncbi:MAG: hypothetical protein F6K52_34315 [Moorea sp. SIO3H5]|nr:hypothetical protein [Moorena sp. SIO3H5]